MPATTFAIIYGTQTNIVRRIILPDTDAELYNQPLAPGESILITPAGPSDIFTCRTLVEAATGNPSPDARHAIVDGNGNVVAIDHIDPVLDGPVVHPGMTYVPSQVAAVGMTFSPSVGFTIPARVLPPGTMVRNAQGQKVPSATAINQPAQVIPGTATVTAGPGV